MADLLNIGKLVLVASWDILLGSALGKLVNCIMSMHPFMQLTNYGNSDPQNPTPLLNAALSLSLLIGLQGFLTLLGYYEMQFLFPMTFLETQIPTLGLFMAYAMFYFQPVLWGRVQDLWTYVEQWWMGERVLVRW